MELWVDMASGGARLLEYVPAILERGRPPKKGTFLLLNDRRRILAQSPRREALLAALAGCQEIDPRPRCAAMLACSKSHRCLNLASATRSAGDGFVHLVCGIHQRARRFEADPGARLIVLTRYAQEASP